jgi:hypothetical protein
MISGVGYAFEPGRRYSIPAIWCAIKMLQPLLVWWSIWSLHDQNGWNFLAFALCFASPAFLYLQVSILLPEQADDVEDWRAHYYKNKTRFFRANIGLALSGPLLVLSLAVFDSAPILASAAALEVALSVVALTSDSECVQAVIVAMTALAFSVWPIFLYTPEAVVVP